MLHSLQTVDNEIVHMAKAAEKKNRLFGCSLCNGLLECLAKALRREPKCSTRTSLRTSKLALKFVQMYKGRVIF